MQESLVFGPGFRSGTLVVLGLTGLTGNDQHRMRLCKVRCDCGKEYETRATDIRTRKISRCRSCNAIFVGSKIRGANCKYFKHGLTGTPEHHIWKGMKERCENPNNPGYRLYGGRGIKVCDQWKDFKKFIEDMGQKPFDNAQIDRTDPDGDYSAENCRWVTPQENHANRRISSKNRDRFVMIDKNKLCGSCKILGGMGYDRTRME